MKKSEAQGLIALLLSGYPRQTLGKESFNLFVEELAPFEFDAAHRSVRTIIRYMKWFPSIAELLDECRGQQNNIRMERTERATLALGEANVISRSEYEAMMKAGADGPTTE